MIHFINKNPKIFVEGKKVKVRFGQSNPPKYKHGLLFGYIYDKEGIPKQAWVITRSLRGHNILIKRKPDEILSDL